MFSKVPPQYSAPTQEAPLTHPSESSTPDAYMLTAPLSQYTNNYVDESPPNPGSRRKPRVKSEKRSQSMTMWWAERKAKKREQDEKEGKPVKPTSRSNSSSRRGRQSGGSATGATPQPQSQNPESQQASPVHHAQHAPLQHSPRHAPPESYLQYTQAPPTYPPQQYMYVSGPPPPHHMGVQYSPLAALPTGSYPSPFTHHSAPPHPQSGIPLSQPPNSAGGSFGGAPRQLAPAPMGMPTYPSPYGPQSPAGGRPKSSEQGLPKTVTNGQQGQQQHFSPYAPANLGREMPFKVMVPGPAPERRGSR
ncbi:PAT1 domain containing protein [Pyrenophora tritici-repentis]|nr:PAT1 domain containing protein [Pyrenophora tritici-repentis]